MKCDLESHLVDNWNPHFGDNFIGVSIKSDFIEDIHSCGDMLVDIHSQSCHNLCHLSQKLL